MTEYMILYRKHIGPKVAIQELLQGRRYRPHRNRRYGATISEPSSPNQNCNQKRVAKERHSATGVRSVRERVRRQGCTLEFRV